MATADTEQMGQGTGLVIGAVAAVLLLASLGQTIVGTALPVIVGELGGLDHLTWVVTAFLLSSTVVAPIYGKLGDLYGRKIVLQVAIVIFLVGAVLCGMANSMPGLIFGRIVQGLGGGGLMVVAIAVVADVIPPRQRGRIQGVFSAVFGVSTAIGPLIGGFLVEHLSWHWIFFVNLPVGLLALAVIAFALEGNATRTKHQIDYLGAALLAAGLSGIVLFTSLGGTMLPWDSAPIIALGLVSVALLVAFVFVEQRAAEPILPLSLFRNHTFVISGGMLFITGLAMFGSLTFLPLFLQTVKGASPSASGLQLLPTMVGLFGASILAGQYMSRTGRYRILPILGTGVLILGLLLLGTMAPETPTWQISLYMFLFGVGLGPITSVTITATQNAVPREMLGVASAGTTLFRQIGGSIGVSVFGAIFANRLAATLGDRLPEGGTANVFNPETLNALPPAAHDLLVNAFATALHPVFWIAAVTSVLAFALSFLLREIPLANTLRREPEAELKAEENAAAAAGGAPAQGI